ncbi:hypothetical protein HDE_06527 [Halotydeus destructor]|nr:hypothetical protein HDE_06527 [Halotydeus destructor]
MDECLSIDTKVEGSQMAGQYCMVNLNFPLFNKSLVRQDYKHRLIFNVDNSQLQDTVHEVYAKHMEMMMFSPTTFRFGLCFPSSCDKSEIEQYLVKNLNGTEIQPSISPFCETKDRPMESHHKLAIIISAAYIGFVCLANLITNYFEHESSFLDYFNVTKNTEKLYAESSDPLSKRLSFFHGTRFYYQLVAISAHMIDIQPMFSTIYPIFYNHEHYWFLKQLYRSTGFFVQIPFAISGCLTACMLYPHFMKKKGNVNYLDLAFKRWFRSTPTLLGVLLLGFAVWWKDLPPYPNFDASDTREYEISPWIYFHTYHHVPAYMIGFLVGYCIMEDKQIPEKYAKYSWYVLYTLVMPLIVIPHYWYTSVAEPTRWHEVVFAGVHRPIFASMFIWVGYLSAFDMGEVNMKVVDTLICFLKVLWKWTGFVLGVLFYFIGYFSSFTSVRITFYSVFIYVGFLSQSYDTGDTHYHESVTKYDASIDLHKIWSPILQLRFPVQDLFDHEEPMTVAEIFDNTPSAEDFFGKCGVHDREGYGEIPNCLPTEQFTVKKFLDKDLLGYSIELNNLTIPFEGHYVYSGGIPPYLWEFEFSRKVTDFLKAATDTSTVKVFVHLFPSYVTSFGQGVTEPYGMTELRWSRTDKVLVNGRFSITYKLRHLTRLEWPMESDCRDYPDSSRGKCMNDCNHFIMKKMFLDGELNGTLPLNFRLYQHDEMFNDLKLALNDDYKKKETNDLLKKVYHRCRHQCEPRECSEILIEPTVVAATGADNSGVRLYAPNKPTIFIIEEEKMTFGQMVVGILSIASFWFPDIHVLNVMTHYWPLIRTSLTVMLATLLDRLVKWFERRYSNRKVNPFPNSNVIYLREDAIYMQVEPDMAATDGLKADDDELSDISD